MQENLGFNTISLKMPFILFISLDENTAGYTPRDSKKVITDSLFNKTKPLPWDLNGYTVAKPKQIRKHLQVKVCETKLFSALYVIIL